jgi:hypothetical protein
VESRVGQVTLPLKNWIFEKIHRAEESGSGFISMPRPQRPIDSFLLATVMGNLSWTQPLSYGLARGRVGVLGSCLTKMKNELCGQRRVSTEVGKFTKNESSQEGRGPECVAREVRWSEVSIHFLQGIAQSLC